MRCDLAVLGGHVLLPGAPSLDAWVRLDRCRLSEASPGRLPAPPRAPHTRGGWIDDVPLDPDVDPDLDPLFHLVVGVARGALAGKEVAIGRTGLVVANLALPTSGSVRATSAPLLHALGLTHPWFDGAMAADRPSASAPARLTARVLGLGGPVLSLDAACASGLYAVAVAADWLRSGACDAVIAVGACRADPWYLLSGFHALRALSPSGRSRPFAADADGLCVGEGAAAALLVRAENAQDALARVHSVVVGCDGRRGNPLAPDADGQLRILREAWKDADANDAAYFECHATGTQGGDRAEVAALAALREGAPHAAVLSSAKALIGHPITAAGIAGLLRAAASLHRRVLQPMPNVTTPLALRPNCRLLSAPGTWEGAPWAGVSAFGFGGTLAHAVLTEATGPTRAAVRTPARLAVVAAAARIGVLGPAPATAHRGLLGATTGTYLSEVEVTEGRWRIPPTELACWLPQQALALDVSGDVASGMDPARTAVIVGMEIDPLVGDHVLDGALAHIGTPVANLAPPLTADRVLGSLPNLVANRLSNQLGSVGPAHAVACGAGSFGAALERASALLGAGVVDDVVVGIADVAGHLGVPHAVEGALMLRVKRAEDADPDDVVAFINPPVWTGGDEDGPPLPTGFVDALLAGDGTAELGGWTASWSAGPRRALARRGTTGSVLVTGGPVIAPPTWSGPWGGDTVPTALPARGPLPVVRFEGDVVADLSPLPWPDLTPSSPLTAPSSDLTEAYFRHRLAVTYAHGRFLEGRARAGDALRALFSPGTDTAPPPTIPRTLDRAALLAHATGPLSAAFGPAYADLDAIRPRVRMPAPPLLLAHRVLDIQGTPRQLGPASMVTEYDVPDDPTWTDGRPPACVVVESGQADLLLVSWLGVDAITGGRAVYRLLDCDLAFHDVRPAPGQTIRHAIRIHRFTRLGDTLLFWFEYDATVNGTPVLTMRDGCAGFFPPAELKKPQGVDDRPSEGTAEPIVPWVSGAPDHLDDAALDALALGHGLKLAGKPWRMGNRVTALSLVGGPHGLGRVRIEQDLRDDDWFNPVHFVNDPCMPGTLMLEGCLQALHVWLLAAGAATAFADARFEPLVDRPIRLRCRGQVAPGHKNLVYDARIREVSLTGDAPYVVADVVLYVDGTPVVRATDVGARIVGKRAVDARTPASVLEFAVGSASAGMGRHYAAWDAPARCARMAGPPIAQIGRIEHVDCPPGVVRAPAVVRTTTSLRHTDALLRADPGPIPLGILLETLLQPCGWLTAWQGAGLQAGRVSCFRNLDGEGVLHRVAWPGDVTVIATQQTSAASGGVRIHVFATVLSDATGPLYEATTRFGYFGVDALARQAGLSLPDEGRRSADRASGAVSEDLRAHPALPRADATFIHRLVARYDGRFYAATAAVDPAAWFFEAHFYQDPVMPGSLGLDGLAQLARVAWFERTGRVGAWLPGPHKWTYRGQVLRTATVVQFEIDVVDEPEDHIVCNGVVRVDGLAIYRLDGLRIGDPGKAPAKPTPHERRDLLDAFTVTGDRGTGHLQLDPTDQPWLDDHRPTRGPAAVPLAVTVAIAAEAAVRMRPGATVGGVPSAEALRWIAVGTEAVRLDVSATRDGDDVRVVFSVAGKPAARAHIRLGPPSVVAAIEPGVVDAVDVHAFAAGGHTFHGPSLSRVTALAFGEEGATATVLPGPLPGPLDAHLLDGATWPMASANPERWGTVPGLAYPVRLDDLVVLGPRPTGPTQVLLRRSAARGRRLVFDVSLVGPEGPWIRYRWTETVVDPGSVLGAPAALRRAFLWERQPVDVHIGRAVGETWEVRPEDLHEPMSGTLLWHWRHPGDDAIELTALLAAKELVRTRLATHPSAVRLVQLSDGIAVAAVDDNEVGDFLRAVGPRTWRIRVEGGVAAWARAGVRAPTA